ncbi:double-strand break repair helicase AddA [Acidisoma silvae]|uniref:DNA 3'-5' helicase n=1 Tax=Acidisoma silvae TaxID=2802396 RepID=A0A963YQB1_9PROT|nr:double-strand break repair helicase AddA [Acidisoma silvae]MCB8874972.1 double-strand break repair helicase AddA [Acidisoma silvae]
MTIPQLGLPLPPTPTADDARVRASQHQMAASNPLVSTFVAASAGSGKTKLLTDRLLRLMLGGVDPGRILCLTFTRNAAAEMALRLQDRLGRWVSLPDDVLNQALAELEVLPSEAHRKRARSLFAIVLDLPGGMRIDTIHAFCQSLLRRFPLEAGISPHFRLVEERDALISLREEQELVLSRIHDDAPGMRDAVDALAAELSADDLDGLLRKLDGARERTEALLALDTEALIASQRRVLGAVRSAEAIWQDALSGGAASELRRVLFTIAEQGPPTVRIRALALLDWLADDEDSRRRDWTVWSRSFFKADGGPLARSTLVGKKLDADRPDLWPVIEAEQARLTAIEDAFAADRLADLSASFLRLALPVLRNQARRRQVEGLMDYGDLIIRSNELLRDPGAAWVLFKLDHGLDHLLLDEVQDTAPAQWTIAGSLTAEFFAGTGAREVQAQTQKDALGRTVFAVGDRKQSIYGFQGADLRSFDDWRDRLRQRVRRAQRDWHDGALDVSFRSVVPVLALVDAVFADPEAARGVVEPGSTALLHVSARPEDGGQVEIWPLTPREAVPSPDAWTIPDSNLGQTSAPGRLARDLAQWIARLTDGSQTLASQGRPVQPGDILVLLQKRAPIAPILVRELKAAGVPVAGLDRLELTAQAAVQDLMALADSLLLPEDDLSFACWLTSPLGNLSDESLMDLAAGRGHQYLSETLRLRAAERPDWQFAWHFYEVLQAEVDYATPHAVLSRALGALGGRARLFRRLGAEAAEPVDELLNAALTYTASHAPSLQSFLHWLRQSTAEAKREPGAAGDAVRIMTVHASKGLQARIVIMADAANKPPGDRSSLLWMQDENSGLELPILCPRKDSHCEASRSFQGMVQARAVEEHHRLLYVAMTRAEDRLIVCGWESGGPGSRVPTWHELIARGFDALSAQTLEDPNSFPPLRRVVTAPQRRPPPEAKAKAIGLTADLPSWMGRAPDWQTVPAPREPPRPTPLAPSRPDDVAFGPVPASDSPLIVTASRGARFTRGTLIHQLLQHMPDMPADTRAEAAFDFLSRASAGVSTDEVETVLAQCEAVLGHPALAEAFAPGSRAEVPLAGEVAGEVITGVVDRLAVTADSVVALDFKTNRQPPATAEKTPLLYLRQMAAYRALLERIFPDHLIHCVLVWTETGTVMPLPDALLKSHSPQARAAAKATN